jgi:hypothetical protein
MNSQLILLQVLHLREVATSVMTKMGQLDESALPTFVKPMKSLVDKVSALYNDIKNDVMGFYNVRLQ